MNIHTMTIANATNINVYLAAIRSIEILNFTSSYQFGSVGHSDHGGTGVWLRLVAASGRLAVRQRHDDEPSRVQLLAKPTGADIVAQKALQCS